MQEAMATLANRAQLARKSVWIVLILGALGLLALWATSRHPAPRPAPSDRLAAVRVSVQTSQRQDLVDWRELAAQVRPLEQVVIRPQVSGQVRRLYFQDGQWVRKGQLLAALDAGQALSERLSTQAELARLDTALATARTEQSRYEQLLKLQAVSGQEAEQARSTVRQLQSQRQAVLAQLQGKQWNEAQRQIYAPFSGQLGLKQVSVGAQVSPSDPQGLVTLTQTQPMAVDFGLPETSLNQQAVLGRPVEIWSLQQPVRLANGRIDRVDSQVQSSTASLPVRVLVDNAQQQFFAGQSVKVRVQVRTLPQVMTVPMPALQQGPEGYFVWTLQQGRARKIPVALREQVGELAVVDGLPEGIAVVRSGFGRIKEGVALSVVAGRGGPAP